MFPGAVGATRTERENIYIGKINDKKAWKSPVLTLELHILYLNDTPACGQACFFFFGFGFAFAFFSYELNEKYEKEEKKR